MKIPLEKDRIESFCSKWGVRELALFGSSLREDFREDSDIDILVSFQENSRRTLFDLAAMKEELEEIFGREIDLVSRKGVERSRNPIRRDAILKSAEAIYVA